MNTNLHHTLLLLIAFTLISGCDLIGNEQEADPVTAGVIVGNSGSFGDANGTFTIYNPQTKAVQTVQVNALLNSFTLAGDRLYAVVNAGSTGRVTVFDTTDYTPLTDYTLATPTRYAALAGNGKLYVTRTDFSDETKDYVAIIDLESGAVKEIEVGFGARDVTLSGGRAYVANTGGTLSVIDIAAEEVVASPALDCDSPYHVFMDGEGELAVVCTGKTVYDENFKVIARTDGAVLFLDPEDFSTVRKLPLDVQLGSANFTQVAHYAPVAEELYAISTGSGQIFRIDTETNRLVAAIEVPDDPRLQQLTAVAYDGRSERLYLGRLDVENGFKTAGTVVVLDRSGAVVDKFIAGVAPAHIDFLKQ